VPQIHTPRPADQHQHR